MKICQKRTIVSLIFILITYSVFTQDIYQIQEVLPFIKSEKTLVIFDIDNTLLQPKTDLGSDQWFAYMVQENIKHGMPSSAALQAILSLYFHVRYNIDLICVKEYAQESMKKIQSASDHVIFLTARSFCLVAKTIEQLHKNGLNFHIPEFQDIELGLPSLGFYHQGVLFCGSNKAALNDKGDVLLSFLDTIGYVPRSCDFC